MIGRGSRILLLKLKDLEDAVSMVEDIDRTLGDEQKYLPVWKSQSLLLEYNRFFRGSPCLRMNEFWDGEQTQW